LRDSEGLPQGATCRGVLDGKGPKKTHYDTTLGPVEELWRETSHCVACGQGIAYLDEWLGITPHHMTPAFASAVAMVGTCDSYGQSEVLLKETLQQEVDDNRIQQTVGYVAKLAAGWATLSEEHLDRMMAELPEEDPLTLYVGVDGGRIRFLEEGWKEPCEGVLWWRDPVTEEGRRLVVGDVRDKSKVLGTLDRFLKAAMQRCSRLTVVIIADGAEWIWNWAKQYEQAIKILDYYHLKEHLCEAGEALYGGDSGKAKQWVKRVEKGVWEGEVAETVIQLERMKPRGTALEKETKTDALTALATYLTNHEGLLAYAEHREQGLTIGSGMVESTCKQLFNMRLKGPGMFWSVPGAQAVIHNRCTLLSGQWDQLWRPPEQHEQPLAIAA